MGVWRLSFTSIVPVYVIGIRREGQPAHISACCLAAQLAGQQACCVSSQRVMRPLGTPAMPRAPPTHTHTNTPHIDLQEKHALCPSPYTHLLRKRTCMHALADFLWLWLCGSCEECGGCSVGTWQDMPGRLWALSGQRVACVCCHSPTRYCDGGLSLCAWCLAAATTTTAAAVATLSLAKTTAPRALLLPQCGRKCHK